jgi:protease-4
MGNQTSGARTLCKQFQEVRKKKRIKAVILRIDSPGGSAAASDLIWREIYLTARQKPVICSMGNTAASGGYYIAAAANHILASPATITGSIGVVGGKFDISGLLEKLKIKTESIQSGARAGYSSLIKPLNSDEQVAVRNILKNFYEKLFLKKVGIKLKKDSKEVKTLAEGRVWTGAQALHLGMVDSEGGLIQAFELACSQAGIPSKKARLSIFSYRSRLRDIIPSRSRSTSTRILAIMPSCLRVK